tara:strand:- start:112 stop:543 length:432 start_codon:yes stop_codon:yes gene_type:complete
MITGFFKKEKKDLNNEKDYILICSLLIHAAKMDENYTEKERQIILKALSMISADDQDKLKLILSNAEKKENESNQILEFTQEIKKYEKNFRLKIIEILWKIIYSDGVSDMYESSLMRRLNKLLYVSDKESANVKQAVIMDIKK